MATGERGPHRVTEESSKCQRDGGGRWEGRERKNDLMIRKQQRKKERVTRRKRESDQRRVRERGTDDRDILYVLSLSPLFFCILAITDLNSSKKPWLLGRLLAGLALPNFRRSIQFRFGQSATPHGAEPMMGLRIED